MSTEKMKVLEMLQQGTITTEDALKLLNHLPDTEESQSFNGKPASPMRPHPPYSMDFGWVNHLKDNLKDVAKQIGSAFGEDSCLLQSEAVTEIKSLRLSGKNDSVEISGYDGDRLAVEAFYSLKSNADPQLSLDGDNGRYTLYYDSNAVYSLKIIAKVPNIFIDYLNAETKNAGLRLRDLHFGEANVSTKNAGISLENLKGEKLSAETKNASVKTRNSDIRKLRVSTTNAGLNFDCYEALSRSQYRNYSLAAKTTNAGIKVILPEEIPLKLRATTTAGSISVKREDLNYETKNMNRVEAASLGYDEDVKKISVELQTSNAGIVLASM